MWLFGGKQGPLEKTFVNKWKGRLFPGAKRKGKERTGAKKASWSSCRVSEEGSPAGGRGTLGWQRHLCVIERVRYADCQIGRYIV